MDAPHCLVCSQIKQNRKIVDSALVGMVAEKSVACRRKALLKQLGSDEILTPSQHDCCDVCGALSVATFKFLTPARSTRKARPTPVRNVSAQMVSLLKARLLRERRRLLDSNMKYKALGGIVACPVASITEICNRVKYIKDLRDITSVPCIPHFFAESFFNIIKDTLQ